MTKTWSFVLVLVGSTALALSVYTDLHRLTPPGSSRHHHVRSERHTGESFVTEDGRAGFIPDLDAPKLLEGEEALIASAVAHFDRTLPLVVGDDPQGRILLDYYFHEVVFGRPRRTGAIIGRAVPGGQRRAGTLPIVIIDPREAGTLGDPNAGLSPYRFRPEMGCILMSPEGLTTPWGEVVLLHEMWHAYSELVTHTSREEPSERLGAYDAIPGEESVAHVLETRLLDQWTSGRYLGSIRRFARTRIDRGDTVIGRAISEAEAVELNSLFAPSEQGEQSVRLFQYRFDVATSVLEMTGSGGPNAARDAYRAARLQQL